MKIGRRTVMTVLDGSHVSLGREELVVADDLDLVCIFAWIRSST